jgi:hypothetical protein
MKHVLNVAGPTWLKNRSFIIFGAAGKTPNLTLLKVEFLSARNADASSVIWALITTNQE